MQKIKNQIQPAIDLQMTAEPHGVYGIPKEDQIKIAMTALKLMGLVQNFAKIVIFCGHKSTTANNPYASALDCGACGGNHGDQNARLLADILNQAFIRQELKNQGIDIFNKDDFPKLKKWLRDPANRGFVTCSGRF